MLLRTYKEIDKRDSLVDLDDAEILNRIHSFPVQDLLNYDTKGPRKCQVGKLADKYDDAFPDERTRIRCIQAFSSATTLGALVENPQIPENVRSFDLWDYRRGTFRGKTMTCGLTETESGIAVSTLTTDFAIVDIGYLDKVFTDKYTISGNQIVTGHYYNGDVELVFDAEELYEKDKESVLTADGKHVYEMNFLISNLQYEDSESFPIFEDNMNHYPIKDMLGDMLKSNGLENPIANVMFKVRQPNDYNKIQIVTDKALDGAQMMCIDQCFSPLTKESFLKTLQDTFQSDMAPSAQDVFCTKSHLAELKQELNPALTNDNSAVFVTNYVIPARDIAIIENHIDNSDSNAQDFADAVAAIPAEEEGLKQ